MMSRKQARERQQAMIAKRRERANLHQRIRDAAYQGQWDELDRIHKELLGESEEQVDEGDREAASPAENSDDIAGEKLNEG